MLGRRCVLDVFQVAAVQKISPNSFRNPRKDAEEEEEEEDSMKKMEKQVAAQGQSQGKLINTGSVIYPSLKVFHWGRKLYFGIAGKEKRRKREPRKSQNAQHLS